MKKFFIFLLILSILGVGVYVLINVKERQVYLSDITPSYSEVGYYDVCYNEDYEKNKLSINVAGAEKECDKGLFVHAHSTLVFDGLKKYNPKMFSVYIGVNKTARNNANTSVKFLIYFDQELVYESVEMNGSSEAVLVELEMSKVNRITLVVDDLNGNANDHAVWALPLLTYKGGKELK